MTVNTTHSISHFQQRQAVLGTRHGKEQVIAPPLAEELGLDLIVPHGFDSDRFGTFTRDVPRLDSQIETARRKALAAIEETGLDIGLASEGTFGPHPALFFVPGNLEIVVLIDRLHNLEIVGKSLTTDVKMVHGYCRTVADAFAVAQRAGFPEHGLVVRASETGTAGMVKGIMTEEALIDAVTRGLRQSAGGSVFVESDLRAHCNPTRMRNIAQATCDLLATVQRSCPLCAAPGFAIVETKPGLPCAWCELPTDLVLSHVYACQVCDHTDEVRFPDGIERADPGHCPYCNP